MLDMAEIDRAIARLESGDTSFSACAKLADLYTVRANVGGGYERGHSAAPAATPDSDFLQSVSRTDSAAAWAVMDELMETLRVVNPRVYDSVMRKLGSLQVTV